MIRKFLRRRRLKTKPIAHLRRAALPELESLSVPARTLSSHYELSERQLRSYLRRSTRMPGSSEDNLAKLLEFRLDNIAFRIGLARTVSLARELVREGHVLVNGMRVTDPARKIMLGDTITFRDPGLASRSTLLEIEGGPVVPLPSYLRRSPDGLSGQVHAEPVLEDIPLGIHPVPDQRIVA